MAEQDESQKTEEPTAKRLEDAVKKGNVVTSQELKTWFVILAAAGGIAAGGPLFAGSIADLLYSFFDRIHEIEISGSGLLGPISVLVKEIVLLMLFPFALFVIAGLASNVMQHPTVISFEKIKPDLGKINPLKGMKRFGSTKLLVDLAKTAGKLTAVTAVVFIIVWPERARLDAVMRMDVPEILDVIHGLVIALVMGVLVFVTVLAVLDYSYEKWKHQKEMRMTKQEVKDERKQSDGDPHIKGRLRSLRMERARNRMMSNVPDADVVITNPTHFAVALVYKHGKMEVPKLIAKGVDSVAFTIRSVAEENGIPIVENPPLARALHAGVDIDEEIPPDHYKAVAEVIGYIMKLDKKTPRKLKIT